MKKIYLGLIILVAVLTVVGCGGGSGDDIIPVADVTENSSYGEYAIAGVNSKSLPEDETVFNEYTTQLELLAGSEQSVDFYMMKYDNTDPLAWIAISANATMAYKLDGVNNEGELIFTQIQGNDLVSFLDIYFNADMSEATFGSTFETNDSISSIVSALAGKSFNVEGYLLQYDKELNSAWMFITADGSYVGILDGANNGTSVPLYREVYTSANEISRMLRDVEENDENNEYFSPYSDINIVTSKDETSQEITGTYKNILFGINRKFNISVSISPTSAIATNGESVTFSVSFKDNNSSEIQPHSLSWTDGPVATCNEYSFGTNSVKAWGVIAGTYYWVTGQLICSDQLAISISGISKLKVGESSQFKAESEVIIDDKVVYENDENVQWSSSSSAIASVSNSGLVTCDAAGSSVISATNLNNQTADKRIECTENFTLSLSGPSHLYVVEDGTFKTKLVSSFNTIDLEHTWYSSSNEAIATITSDGIATCIADGPAAIRSYTDEVLPEGATLNNEAFAILVCKEITPRLNVSGASPIRVGDSAQYNASFKNEFQKTSNVTRESAWSSSSSGIADVGIASGIVTCITEGASTIKTYHVYKNETYQASSVIECTDEVTEEPTEETLNYCVPEGPAYFSGTVTTSTLEELAIHFYNLMFGSEADGKIPVSGSAWMDGSGWAGTSTETFTDDKFWFTFESGEAYINTDTGKFVINFPSGSTFNGNLGEVANGDCYPGGPIENPDGTTDNVSMDTYEQTNSDPGA